ncbi:MAG: hypothetical protein RL071_3576 [Pseudomonadota bacterium]
MHTTSRSSVTVTIGLTAALEGPQSQAALAQGAPDSPIELGALSGLPLHALLQRATGSVVLQPTDAPDAPPLTLRRGGPGGALRFDDGRQLYAELGLAGLTLRLDPAAEAIEGPAPLPEGLCELAPGLPPALRAAVVEQSEADRPDAGAGLLLRWAWSTPLGEGQPCCAAVRAWWAERPAAQRGAVAGWALAQAEVLIDSLNVVVDAGSEESPLDAAAAEALALDRDALASSCALLFAAGEGLSARQAERAADDLLRRAFVAAGPLPPFRDPALDALARRGAGWWCAAPGGHGPPLDADAFTVDAHDELLLAEDIDAFEEEAAEAAEPVGGPT